MSLTDRLQEGCERYAELAQKLPSISRRGFLKAAGYGVAGMLAGKEVYAQQQDLYNPRAPELSEGRFKKTIAKESADSQYVWVQYTFTCVREPFKSRGDEFWKVLKQEFPDAKYITIDVSVWPSFGTGKIPSSEEIGSRDYPGYVLYRDSKIFIDKEGDYVTAKGPPKSEQIPIWIDYLKQNKVCQ